MFENSYTEATAISMRNSHAKWPVRHSDNRLEPECWPHLAPTFKFDKTTKMFAIGSCFARNIEGYLSRNGFNVPSAKIVQNSTLAHGASAEILNKYTPPSIYQELAWTKQVLDRD